jgi:hypothetical protein
MKSLSRQAWRLPDGFSILLERHPDEINSTGGPRYSPAKPDA